MLPFFQRFPAAVVLAAAEEDERIERERAAADAAASRPADSYECAVCGRSLRKGRYLIVKNCKHEECPHK